MTDGIIGKKMGMTQVYGEGGKSEAITAIEAGPCTVVQVKTSENDGYTAAKLGFGAARKINSVQKGQGMGRLSGAGPAEWGRVIVSAEVKSSHTDEVTKETAVVLELVFVGDEIPETTLTIRRRVRAVDPDDLASPLVYSGEIIENAIRASDDDDMHPRSDVSSMY